MNAFYSTRSSFAILVSFFFFVQSIFATEPILKNTSGFAQEFFHRFEAQFKQHLAMFMPPSCILLTNTDLNTNLTGWTTSGTVTSITDAYAGGRAAELTSSWATMKQTKTGPVAGRVYTLSAYAKKEGSPSWAVLLIRFYNSGGTLLSENTISVNTTTYTEHRLSATAPAGTSTISIDMEKSGTGKLKVDEFCLEETIPTVGQCILVENAGFETGSVGWDTWNGSVTISSDEHSGASAAQLSSAEMSMYRQFGVTPGETYQLTAWAKTSGSINWSELFLNWKDASGNTITDIIQPVDDVITSYSQFNLKGVAPSNAVYAEVGAYKDGSGSLYLDDLCFSLATALGGSSFDLSCGCSENLVPNGGFESSNVSSFPYTLDGKPAAAIAQNNNTSLYPWSAGISSYYMFYVKDTPSTVNNPEGDYYVWLPNSGDCWVSNTDFSNNLLLEDGETYTFCFYAASRALSLNSSGFPTGGVPAQSAGILNLEFTFVSGFRVLNSWSVPASSSATNLSWTKYEYTFTYDILDPISNFVFTNSRSNVGMYIDAVSLSKVNCPAAVTCNSGGITYERWGSISGTAVNDLVSNADYPNNYDETGFLTSFQGPQNYNNNYGTKVYGYLVPPATGNYTFTVTSGDASKLYLSTNTSSLNKSLAAEVTGFTGVTEYAKYAAQTSATKALVAGQVYYIELVQKAGSVNSDHFQVYWQTPSNSTRTLIPGSVLRPVCSTEVCDNGRDDDFDGLTDCADGDCSSGMGNSYAVTDEACGVANGAIDMQPTGADAPFSYRWSDMAENAMWTFEDDTDDKSGNGKNSNGITGYPIYTGDEIQGNKSLYFNGSTAIRYSIDGGFMEVSLNSLTVSMWIKPDNLSGTKTLFEEGGSNTSSGIGIAMQLSNSTLQAGVRRSSSTLYSAGTLTFPSDGDWHHVAMVFNAGKIRLYLDGTPGTETTANFTSLTAHSNNGGIGGSFSGSVISSNNNYYSGKMDDVRYYFNQALSTAQISNLATNNGDRTSLAAGVYNVTVSSASGCSVTQSVTVASGGNYTSGGTINGNETGCGSSYDPALISSTAAPSPGAGTTEYKWQYSDNSGTTWVDIASSNSASYDPPSITAARMYRRAARLLPCTGWVFSNNITKSTTANYLTGGTISSAGNESNCGAYDPQVMTATSPTSGADISFKIDPPVSGSSNGATYTITNQGGEPMFLTVTGSSVYKVTVKGGPVTATYLTPPFTGMTAPINPNNGTPYGISHFDIWVSGSVNGSTEYKWQQSTDGGTVWTDISSSNSATYDPPTVTETTTYRRGARIAECSGTAGGGWLYTGSVTKTVELNVTDPGIIVGDEENCGSFDPGIISSVSTPSGGAGGTLLYQWQLSTNGGTTWADITGASLATIDPITITSTTRYRRGARRATCSAFIYSNEVVKMVASNFTSAGSITGAESYCTSYNPTVISSTVLPSGGVDGYTTYRWQQSTDLGTTWTDISGATTIDYDPVSTMTVTTWYRRQTRRTPCTAWINSNTIVKEVKETPVSSIYLGPTTTNGFICEAISYQFQATDAGAGVTYSWSFGSYATPSTATGVGPHTVSFNVPNSPAYTVVPVQLTVTKNGCPGVSTTNYNVRPPFTISSISSTNPTACNNPNGSLTVNATSPSGTTLEASINGTTWVSSPMTFTGLGPGNYNVWVRYSGDECMVWWGDRIIEEPTNPNPVFSYWNTSSACLGAIFTVQGSASSGSTVTWDFGTDAVPATANGLGPHSLYYTSGGIKTMRITATNSGCTGYEERNFTVIANFSTPGVIGSDEALCANGVPTVMTTITPPAGGYGGTVNYAWEQNQLLGTVWSGWTTISGAISASYSPPSISVTTQYRRRARRSSCGSWIYSNIITKTVTQLPQPADDSFSNACPGFVFVGYVGTNDANLDGPVYSIASQPNNGFLDMDTDGEFYYVPNTTFCGGDQFTYQVCNSTTGCCNIATAYIDMSDDEAPLLNNIPDNISVHCDEEITLPPVVDAFENCGSVWLSFDQETTQGTDSCSIYSHLLTRVWTASDYCGNSVIDHQVITVQDITAPSIYRIYTLPNGKRMVAGVMKNVTHRWKTIAFPIQFTAQPVVLTQVVSRNENAAVVTRLRNVSTSQFQMRVQEEENNDGQHLEESIAWIAIEKGTNTLNLPFEAGSKLVNSNATVASFTQSYATPGLIGQIQTFNENNPAYLRIQSLNASSATLFCQEENSFDPEMNHGFETVGYLAFGGSADFKTQDGEVFGETGTVTVDHNFQTVNLNHRYHNPVVVLGGIPMSDGEPATLRVQGVTPTSFQVQIDEWDYLDGAHGNEVVNYMVVEGSIPFDREVECSEIPPKPIMGVEIVAVDNCDISTPLVITDNQPDFDCVADTMSRIFYVRDECGNFTQLTQKFILRDTTPPTFSIPADITITCDDDRDNLTLTGDVTDENDNCASGIEAVYADNLSYQNGCSGYILRLWSLTDHCGNEVTQTQTIRYISANDTDNDGVADDFDFDSDNDGVPDLVEGTTDFDGDGVPNHRDLDCDNDGITDIIEAGFQDRDGDGMVDNALQMGWDVDEDGYAYGFDANDNSPDAILSVIFVLTVLDPDGDGQPNFADLDSDNDGTPDLIEAGGVDTDGNGILDYPIPGDPSSMEDGDSDGYVSVYDPDEDVVPGDENPSRSLVTYDGFEYSSGDPSQNPDFDGDTVPDFLDLDADNDGFADLIEVGGVDQNGDGRIELTTEFEDLPRDGFHDNYADEPRVVTEGDGTIEDGRPEDVNSDGSVYERGDDDADNLLNFRDLDSDGDGILGLVEVRLTNYDQDSDGMLDVIVDNNGDGFHDGFATGGIIYTDSDGSTNDGQPQDDSDTDTTAYASTIPEGSFGDANDQPDVDDDGDGLLNFRDTDCDNDGIRDDAEDRNRNGSTETTETNPLNNDTDGDNLPDGVEDTNQNGFFDLGETNPTIEDTDGDLLTDDQEDPSLDGALDAGESDPRNPCDPVFSANCVGIAIRVKAKLQGAMINNGNLNGLMRDNLRSLNHLPSAEPYKNFQLFRLASEGGTEACDPAVFNQQGANAVVDWMLVELRQGSQPDSIVATRSCLLQRDGDLVMANGDTILRFNLVRSGEYYIALRHRNHLGVMTEESHLLSPDPVLFDFTDDSLEVKGNNSRVDMGDGEMALWGGDFSNNRQVVYQGPNNDILTLLFHILLHPDNPDVLANYISQGYLTADFNLDGKSILQGPNNDRGSVLVHATLNFDDNSGSFANYVISDKLPETNLPAAAPKCGDDPEIPACDFDGDGTINDLDLDDDNDGVYDDDDINPFDTNSDSDADGIKDGIETGGDGRYNPSDDSNPLVQDTDGDGLKDGVEDANKNGIQEPNESNPLDKCHPIATASACDYDGDGIINLFDLDDDNDGVADQFDEGDFDPNSDSDNDGVPDNEETGGDGIFHAAIDSDPLNPCDPSPSAGDCDTVDADGDGFFENYPSTHLLFDQNDSNPCVPSSSVSACPCEDEDGDGKILICQYPGTPDRKTKSITLWLWTVYASQGAICGPCQE